MSIPKPDTKWNPDLYDDKHAFVFKYGEDLVKLLDPKPGERILDLGCGTGYLTQVIAESGAQVTGVDRSAAMIAKAEKEYPGLHFEKQSASDFKSAEPFDAIFSNAVLHWIMEKEEVIDCMFCNLKKGGRLVLEMGGKNNVASIIVAMEKSLSAHGFAENSRLNPWYFPSLGEYACLLEKRGFRVVYAAHFDRETVLKESSEGMTDWIRMFGNSFLKNIPENIQDAVLRDAEELLRPTHFINGKWVADYKRLRIVAFKP